MNLVIMHRKLSTIAEMCNKYSFSVVPFPEKKGKYCIQYKTSSAYSYLEEEFVSDIMRKAMQYKTNHQDRIVFKTGYKTMRYNFSVVIVFDSQLKAKKALNNLMQYIDRRHGSLADQLIFQLINKHRVF